MITEFERILIIQTAFIGDVILSTPVIEKLNHKYPKAQIDFLLRKGNESLFQHDHRIHRLLIWDKQKGRYKSLFRLIKTVRANRYQLVINLHRFASTGLITWLSGADLKVGFDKNPFSFSYDIKEKHRIKPGIHEVDRNLSLIEALTDDSRICPSLILGREPEKVRSLKRESYIVMAPASVWFTKQLPEEKWIELIEKVSSGHNVYLIGAKGDYDLCERIRSACQSKRIQNLCGQFSILESAMLMKDAVMNYVNDSAPLHLASAVNAPVTVFYCSTVPDFGFGPLSEESRIIQIDQKLTCRPCGLHGKRTCPQGHFKCGYEIDLNVL